MLLTTYFVYPSISLILLLSLFVYTFANKVGNEISIGRFFAASSAIGLIASLAVAYILDETNNILEIGVIPWSISFLAWYVLYNLLHYFSIKRKYILAFSAIVLASHVAFSALALYLQMNKFPYCKQHLPEDILGGFYEYAMCLTIR